MQHKYTKCHYGKFMWNYVKNTFHVNKTSTRILINNIYKMLLSLNLSYL